MKRHIFVNHRLETVGSVPVRWGGTHARTPQTACKNLGLVSRDQIRKPFGVIVLGEDGFIKKEDLPLDVINSDRPTLFGENEIDLNKSMVVWITNFSSDVDYVITAVGGVATRFHDKIVFVSGSVIMDGLLTVNGRPFPIYVGPKRPMRPAIIAPTGPVVGMTGPGIKLVSSDYVAGKPGDVHAVSNWRIATDSNMTNVVFEAANVAGSMLTVWEENNLQRNTEYFAQVQHVSGNQGSSLWSEPFWFKTRLAFVPEDYAERVVDPYLIAGDDLGADVGTSTDGAWLAVGAPGTDTPEADNRGSLHLFSLEEDGYTHRHIAVAGVGSATLTSDVAVGGGLRAIAAGVGKIFSGVEDWDVPSDANNVTVTGKGGPGYQTPRTAQGLAIYPDGLPPYNAGQVYVAPTGSSLYPNGLPVYKASYYVAGQGDANYPNGLPPYQAAYYQAQVGDPNYPSGLPPYVAPSTSAYWDLRLDSQDISWWPREEYYNPPSPSPTYAGQTGGAWQTSTGPHVDGSGNQYYRISTGHYYGYYSNVPGQGSASYPSGLPPYQAGINQPQVGLPAYPSGLPVYQAGYTVPAVGNPDYPNGLPVYSAGQPYIAPSGNPAYPSGLPVYQEAGYDDHWGEESVITYNGMDFKFPGGFGLTAAVETSTVIALGTGYNFGYSVAISDNSAVAGAACKVNAEKSRTLTLSIPEGASITVDTDSSFLRNTTYLSDDVINIPANATLAMLSGKGVPGGEMIQIPAYNQNVSGNGNVSLNKHARTLTVTAKGANAVSDGGVPPYGNTFTSGSGSVTVEKGVTALTVKGKGGDGTSTYNPGQPYIAPTPGALQWELLSYTPEPAGFREKIYGAVGPVGDDVPYHQPPSWTPTAEGQTAYEEFSKDYSATEYWVWRYTWIARLVGASPGQPYVEPSTTTTTGANSTFTINGQTYTFPGGVGIAATELTQNITLPGTADIAGNYSVGSGGSVDIRHTGATIPALNQNISGASSIAIRKYIKSLTLKLKGAAGTTTTTPGGSYLFWEKVQTGYSAPSVNPGDINNSPPATAPSYVGQTGGTYQSSNGPNNAGTQWEYYSVSTGYWVVAAATYPDTVTTTTGASSTFTINGQTYTGPGGVGGAATEQTFNITLPGTSEITGTYSIASGGTGNVSHASSSPSGTAGANTTVTVNGQTYTFNGATIGSATPRSEVIQLSGVASATVNYSVASGGTCNLAHLAEEVPTIKVSARDTTLTGSGQTLIERGVTSVSLIGKGASGVNTNITVDGQNYTFLPGNETTTVISPSGASALLASYNVPADGSLRIVHSQALVPAQQVAAVSEALSGAGSKIVKDAITSLTVKLKGAPGSTTPIAGQGNSAYPNGLPPYKAGQPYIPDVTDYIWILLGENDGTAGYPPEDPADYADDVYPFAGHMWLSVSSVIPGQPYIAQEGNIAYPAGLPTYIAPSSSITTGVSATFTVNGQTYTGPGGVGAAAQEQTFTIAVPGGASLLAKYSIPAGGTGNYAHDAFTPTASRGESAFASISGSDYPFYGGTSTDVPTTTHTVDFNNGQNVGSITTVVRDGYAWGDPKTILPPESRDNLQFGRSFDFDALGEQMLVGAPGSTTPAIYFYTKDPVRGMVIEQSINTVDGATSEFGHIVRLSGDGQIAVVGVPGYSSQRGKVMVYSRTGNYPSRWQLMAAISKPLGASLERFGHAVDVSYDGSVVLIGAPGATSASRSLAGEAYIYERSGNAYNLTATLISQHVTSNDAAGSEVCLDAQGMVAIVGAPNSSVSGDPKCGAAFTFAKYTNAWQEEKTLYAPLRTTEDNLGNVLALSSNSTHLAAGVPKYDYNGQTDSGVVIVFDQAS